MINLKSGELMIRYCTKDRTHVNKAGHASTFHAVHDFTIWSDTFGLAGAPALKAPDYVFRLYEHLQHAFLQGCPQRDSTASKSPALQDLKMVSVTSDLPQLAKEADYRNWSKDQHPIVQRYLRDHDPKTIATEAPVWDAETNGFMDMIRLHPESGWTIEIADFKPDLPASAKRSPAFPMATKKMQQIAAQLHKYRGMLSTLCVIPSDKIFCTAFDDEACFALL